MRWLMNLMFVGILTALMHFGGRKFQRNMKRDVEGKMIDYDGE